MIKINFEVEDGTRVESCSFHKAIEEMKRDTKFYNMSVEDYMERVRGNIKEYDKEEIEFSGPRDFILELVRVGVIVELKIKHYTERKCYHA